MCEQSSTDCNSEQVALTSRKSSDLKKERLGVQSLHASRANAPGCNVSVRHTGRLCINSEESKRGLRSSLVPVVLETPGSCPVAAG